jgi:hypothetical protein
VTEISVALDQAQFGEAEKPLLRTDGLDVSLFRYQTGVAAARITNRRGHLIVLPYLGQMIWDVVFDGVRLTMGSMFAMPRPADGIRDTYGCFCYHCGILRMGNPGPEDDHPLHGEMPCAPMDGAWLEVGEDEEGPLLRLVSEREYIKGFGDRYIARPSVTVRPDRALIDIAMAVENRAGRAMDLMYMCHVNFALPEGGRIVQPAAFTGENMVVRTAVPSHVPANPEYLALIAAIAHDPSILETLDDPDRFDPEQVCYIRNLRTDARGVAHFLLRRREGDGFAIGYRPTDFPHTVRWILCNADQQVAGFALPSTCEPEGYTAEKRKGNVQSLPPGGRKDFSVRAGYLGRGEAESLAALIRSL